MSNVLPLTRPEETPVPLIDLVEQYQSIKNEIQEVVQQVFETQGFVLGENVSNFESEIARYCDSRNAVGCASGTDALILALMALSIGEGDEVITSPYSFFATASSIARVGATPVFVDIDPVTYNLDPAAVDAAVTSKTRAIMPVHLFGQCADMEPIWRTAVRHNLAIVEDAAQAIGAEYRGRKAGVLGTLGCFSFFPTKNLGGAGDGGMVTTDDRDLTARLTRLRVHGDIGGYTHVEVGLNSRLDALQAAVLSVKLKYLDQWSDGRTENARRYEASLESSDLQGRIALPTTAEGCKHIYNQFTVRIADGHRDEVLQGLRDRSVGCSIYYPKPLHLQQCFASLGYQEGQFPEAERAATETIALPIYAELGEARQARVIEAFHDVYKQIDSRNTQRRRAA
ncbi:UNVERIFIED_CONTAM: hypothetical protein GTU68_031879 [Idotea baltica]|nr:hypothetical protein [Idotea baltica]